MAMTITLDDKVHEIKRELAMRRGLYPHWVKGGKMTREAADHQISVLAAILDDYERPKEPPVWPPRG